MKNDLTQANNLVKKCLERKNLFLDLSNCHLTSLSDLPKLLECKHIELLFLGDNLISDINLLKNLTQLKSLYIRSNQISDISFLKDLKQLNTLYIRSNQISDIRPLKELPQLNSLDLSDNQISDISFLKDLTQLNSLDLSSNQISDISFLKDLTQLNSLDLRSNQISDISFLKDLTQLSSLYLSYNKIAELPIWITEFDMEITLDQYSSGLNFYDNPIKSPPLEIVKQGKEAIRNYFKYKKYDYLFEAKLILVGEERAGKSTIAKALHQDNFKIDLMEKSTEGIDVIKWVIPKEKANTEKDYRFNIWDFGGQEIYHATHQFFLTKRSLYLFVTEARKDLRFDDFYYWLNIINSLVGNSPVILVQNKADQPHQDVSIEKYTKEFSQIYDGLIKVSCNTEEKNWTTKYCHLLEGLKGTIFEIIKEKHIEGIGDQLPKEWIAIRHDISEINDDYISLQTYYKICEKYKIDEKGALHLSDYFHDLGVFLHFKDDINLRNTIFLNHEWVTKAIYNVFENDKIKNKTNGKFYDSDLIAIWDEPRFKGKEQELLNLMKTPQFKICYQHKDGYYLAPQLFNDKEVKYQWRTAEDNLFFRYNYTFMPKGILSQLIVMLNQYIYQDIYWKYGVLFEYKNTRAIVIENHYDKNNIISIQVEGEQRQAFLSIIGNKIEEINSSYTNLAISEEFGCNCEECITSSKPYFWKTSTLNRAKKKGKVEVECQNSFIDVQINQLVGSYIPHQVKSVANRNNNTIVQNIFKGTGRDYSQDFEKLNKRHDRHDGNFEEINSKLDEHYYYLISMVENQKIKKSIIPAVAEIANELRQSISDDMLTMIATGFECHQGIMDDKLLYLYNELKKSDDLEMKIKVSVPLLNLMGVDIGIQSKLDIKGWSKKMYQKHELKIFKLFGYI